MNDRTQESHVFKLEEQSVEMWTKDGSDVLTSYDISLALSRALVVGDPPQFLGAISSPHSCVRRLL
jgi:hypothetical protein